SIVSMRRLLVQANRVEKVTLLAMVAATAMVFAFVQLADEVVEGTTRAFDERLLLMLRSQTDRADPIGPQWLEDAMRDITALGGASVLTLVVLVVAGFLAMIRRRQSAAVMVLAILTGVLLGSLMKIGFARPRPDLVPHGTRVASASFPSGHATLSAVVYLTLGALLCRTQSLRSTKIYILTVAAFLTLIVGLSRVYLGVHWPTDVIAGWLLGTSWALVCWMAMLWLQSQSRVEPEGDSSQTPTSDHPR
ncbi:MAG: phosphatase PAP2 family protein, partial [Hyphomicrobiaceae bacterium]